MSIPSKMTAFGSSIRWGILSAGKISSDFVKAIAITEGAGKFSNERIESILFSAHAYPPHLTILPMKSFAECAAVAARNGNKAAEFAQAHGIPKSYGNYDELLADPSIDVVYVGSIADQHSKMAKQALLAGKPTVVEKPLTLTTKETIEVVQLAKNKDLFLT